MGMGQILKQTLTACNNITYLHHIFHTDRLTDQHDYIDSAVDADSEDIYYS